MSFFWRTGFLLFCALSACQPTHGPEVVAEVNDEAITLEELEKTMGEMGSSAEGGFEVRRRVLEQMIDERLILQRAEELGVSLPRDELNQVEAKIKAGYTPEAFRAMLLSRKLDHEEWRQEIGKRLLIEKVLTLEVDAKVVLDPEEVKQALVSSTGPEAAEKIKIAQIVTEDKSEAAAARAELMSGKPFDEVAQHYSLLANQAGQQIDYFARGDMPEELEEAVWKLEKGQVSQVVQGAYGWHVFLVLDRQTDHAPASSTVISELKNELKAERQAVWLEKLRKRAKIKLYLDRLSDSPQTFEEE